MRKLLLASLFAAALASSAAAQNVPVGPGPLPGVQGPTSAVSGVLATFNGTSGKIIGSYAGAAGTGCTNQFTTNTTLTAAGAVTNTCSTATLAGAQFANQGTTTTVLHGNAAGNPSWAQVAIGADVSGLGTGVATLLSGASSGTGGPAGKTSPQFSGGIGVGVASTGADNPDVAIYGGGELYSNSASNDFRIGSNVFIQGGQNIYKATAAASTFTQSGGSFAFATAASGTAGNAISFSTKATLALAGTWQWNAYGAGAITSDASGNLTSASDERLKVLEGKFSPTLGMLRQAAGATIVYKWNALSKLETAHDYAGFSAQRVRAAFGPKYADMVTGQDGRGFYTLQDRALLAGAYIYASALDNRITALFVWNALLTLAVLFLFFRRRR
jgi:hypothetical protein